MPKTSRNRTIRLTASDRMRYKAQLLTLSVPAKVGSIVNRTINQNIFECAQFLPKKFVDLLIIDPPYNQYKIFNSTSHKRKTHAEYEEWMNEWFFLLLPTLKDTASVYVCGDWNSSAAIYHVLAKHLTIRNRITWEREKGRGAAQNWKNCSEDIWFATVGNEYTFNVDDVKLRRRVIAPYRTEDGMPKDWFEKKSGAFRDTHPSNLWTDITVPFWSMPENTEHPTQKPEKLLAKLILASSNADDVILDPFMGSGTTSVTAKKLGRKYVGVEIDTDYCIIAEKRLRNAESDRTIQGYDGIFWDRNTHSMQNVKRIFPK